MRRSVLAAAAAGLIGGGILGSVLLASAQPPPQPGVMIDDPHHGPPWMHWWDRGAHRRPFEPGTFALVHRAADRQLTPPDVQKIAEAFLLWNGNHTWKVVDVAPAPSGAIGFAVATPEGSVIARFEMDPHTAHVTRTG